MRPTHNNRPLPLPVNLINLTHQPLSHSGWYRFDSRLFKLTYIECIGGFHKVHEMVLYALHLLFCDFIGDDICTAEELS